MDNKEELLVDKLLCVACLCVGRTLHPLTDEKIQIYYLEILNEIPQCNPPESCPSVCWECKAQLCKAIAFREQVKDSYKLAQSYTKENLQEHLSTDITRLSRLSLYTTESVSVPPDPNHVQDVHVYVKDEVKIEWQGGESAISDNDQASDIDHDIDDTHDILSESNNINIETELQSYIEKDVKKIKRKREEDNIKNAKKIVKALNIKDKPKKQIQGKKIITIELSYEEMLLERERESTKDSYVNAEYKCESCLIGFNYNKSYKAHVAGKHSAELGDFSCPICKTVMSSVESFTSHYKRHLRRYECTVCDKRTMDLKVMQQHYYSNHEDPTKQYKCHICGFISKTPDSHRYHKETHKARVPCNDCDKTFTHRAGLMNHRVTMHESHQEYRCTECDKVFRWKTSLKRHLEKHVAKTNENTTVAFCTECDIGFASVSSYQRHLRSSLKHVSPQQLKFICDHCKRRFADKTKLRDHIEEKHLNKTYQCHICLKPSKNRVGLDQHIRNVHKGRPNNKMCHHCGKGFPTKMQLESHIRTHTGERPFICEYCPTTFSQQSNLYKHYRQVHLNIKSKKYPVTKKQTATDVNRPVLHYTTNALIKY